MRRGDSWFLRGILCFSAADEHVFTDLNEYSVRNWLRGKINPEANSDRPAVRTVTPLSGARTFFFNGLTLDLGLIALFGIIAAAGAYFLVITFWPNRGRSAMAAHCQCCAITACWRQTSTPAARRINISAVATDHEGDIHHQADNSDDEETRPALAVIFNSDTGVHVQARK